MPSRRRTTSSRHQRFFLSVVGELGFNYIAVERALLVERDRRGRVEAVRAMVAAGAVSQPMSAAPRSVCCRTLARHRIGRPADRGSAPHDQRIWRRSRARATDSAPVIVPAPAFRVRARFDSGRDIVETGTAWCLPCSRGAGCLFLPANTARLLVGISVGIGNNRCQKLV
jgi:hypothetical protein